MKTIISRAMKSLNIPISKEVDKKLTLEFKNHLVKENLSRFLLLLSLVAFAQIAYIFFELTKKTSDMLILRSLVISIATVLVFIFYFFSKKNANKYSPIYNEFIIFTIQFITYILGFYFVSHMFYSGIYSFNAFLIAAYVISLTYTHSPHYTALFQFIFFIGLAFHIDFFIVNISFWFGEFIICLVFLILLYVGSIYNYKRQFKGYLQDKEIAKQNERLKILLQFDDLTGIYNRKEIFKQIEQQVSMSQRYKTPFCITILDIDHFKNVNDTYGHNIGDEILKEFAKKINSMLRNTDMFGRWGGEEFIIVLPNSKAEDACSFIERIRKSIEKFNFPTVGQVTFSAGISMYNNETDASEIVKKADSAMYMAKEAGRNQTHIYKK